MSGLEEAGIGHATRWRFGYLLSQAGFSLLLFVCLAQVLPADAFAAAALAQGTLVIVQALGDFGLSQAAVTALPAELARREDAQAQLMRGAAMAFMLAAAGALLLAVFAAVVVPGPARLATLLIGPAAAASLVVSGADGLLRSVGEFRRPVVLVTLSRAGAFLALPAAAVSESAAWTSAGLSLGAAAMTLPAFGVLMGAIGGSGEGSAAELLRSAVPLGLAQIFIVAAGRLNTLVVGGLISLRAGAAFEGAWRLFQLGQYAAGGLATGTAPFVGHAVGGAEHSRLRRLLLTLIAWLALAGIAFGLALWAFGPWVSRLLLGSVGDDVADVLLPFALLSPLAFVGFLALTTLSTTEIDRKWVPWSYATGAGVGVPLVALLGESRGLEGATAGCAVGWAIAQVMLIHRLVLFIRRADRSAAQDAVLGPMTTGPVEET